MSQSTNGVGVGVGKEKEKNMADSTCPFISFYSLLGGMSINSM